AKLDLLREMLPSMVEEGRRILLFSQFTGMLALIAQFIIQVLLMPLVLILGDGDRVRGFEQVMTAFALIGTVFFLGLAVFGLRAWSAAAREPQVATHGRTRDIEVKCYNVTICIDKDVMRPCRQT
ncbi:hypothetical protein ABGA94_17205, partial [Stenotrophomonas sp. 3diitr2024]